VTAFGGGRPSFALLQRRLHVTRPALALVAAVPVTSIAFDLLRQAGRPLLRSPYAQRHALLDSFALTGLEGVVLKRLASSYQRR
jgi:bifunctional non-homologous end joining protein LigD